MPRKPSSILPGVTHVVDLSLLLNPLKNLHSQGSGRPAFAARGSSR
jgi:hypothetical protein